MQDLLKAIEYLKNYGQALQNSVEKFIKILPIHTEAYIKNQAKRKLQSTFGAYTSALDVKMNRYLLVVELDPDNWVANAVESGVGQFSMKDTLLNSPKAKLSKKGYRYMHIPIGHDKNKRPGTEKGQDFQKRINEVLNKSKVGMHKLTQMMNGSIRESYKIESIDPSLSGLYMTRVHENAQDYYSGRSKPEWQYILFRTISENPESKSQWQHPGIKPVHILKKAERWLGENAETMLEDIINAEMKSLHNKMKET